MAEDLIEARSEGATAEAWRRGLASAAALLVAMLLIALVILVSISNRDRDTALVRERRSYDVIVLTRQLDATMARSEAALGRFVISGDQNTGRIYYDQWRRAGTILRRLRELTAADPTQIKLVETLESLYQERGAELAAPARRSAYRQGMNALSLYYDAGKSPSIGLIDSTIAQIAHNERTTLRTRSGEAAQTAERSNYLAALLSSIGIMLVLGAIALGWTTVAAIAQRRLARKDADAEAERAEWLEEAVAERTRELSTANERLREEASERQAAESKLHQVQKMEAVGQLTGGIAHDFNNMLAVVVGGLDLARRRVDQEAREVTRHIDNAMEGANRAAALTKRLLAFARAEPLLPENVAPDALIAGMSDLLDRTLGERVTIKTHLGDTLWQVWCDRSQLENAILNLAVNARDAMDGEGTLRIETANAVLGNDEIGEAKAGEYVRIAVTDNGCGMTPEVMERVFEPFFTTKPIGKGTGLGLSQIFGFARQSGGDVDIQSTPGQGTTVSIFLPRRFIVAETTQAAHVPAIEGPMPTGATILVVEDDARVRTATVNALAEVGHIPLACAGGEEALALLAERPEISMIVTDVVMPGMTGPELIAKAAPLYPGVGVLYVTGYVGEAGDADQFAGYEVLRKPFTLVALQRAVARALANLKRQAA